jgi:Spy/CpxP family protein refolding chaperone
MRKLTLIFLCFLFAGTTAFATEPQVVERPPIELKDGGKIVFEKDGTMAHIDAAGNRLKMRDGTVMDAKDGTKVMMKNNAIWQTLSVHGTLKPGH